MRLTDRGRRDLITGIGVLVVLRQRFRCQRTLDDIDGRFVCPALRERVIALDARLLGRLPVAIGVASGENKVRPILGAIRAGVVRTLVTDVATAEAVVALDAAAPTRSTGGTA